MAKRQGERTPGEESQPVCGGDAAADGSDQVSDREAEIQAAEEAVRRAEEELAKARRCYKEVRQQAACRLKEVGEKTVAQLVECTLSLTKRHPGPSLLAASLVGFLLGRLFRR